jgi:hypothetical protein
MKSLIVLCWGQGLYFLLTGVWPLFSMRTFELVTGPKTDDWLVKTVAVLIIVASAVLLRAAISKRPTVDTLIVGAGTSIALMNIDLIYALSGVISVIYLGDAAVELVFLGLWTWCAPHVLRKS